MRSRRLEFVLFVSVAMGTASAQSYNINTVAGRTGERRDGLADRDILFGRGQ